MAFVRKLPPENSNFEQALITCRAVATLYTLHCFCHLCQSSFITGNLVQSLFILIAENLCFKYSFFSRFSYK